MAEKSPDQVSCDKELDSELHCTNVVFANQCALKMIEDFIVVEVTNVIDSNLPLHSLRLC